MIANVIQLGDRVARQVMTPRPDIVAVPQSEQIRTALALAHEHGLSRLPVYDDDLDSVTGILHVREASAALLDGQPPPDLSSLVRAPLFVPEMQRVDLLLRELRARNTHMAIVVNEHGETVGLVTIEDLLEEIVGRDRRRVRLAGGPDRARRRGRRRGRRRRPHHRSQRGAGARAWTPTTSTPSAGSSTTRWELSQTPAIPFRSMARRSRCSPRKPIESCACGCAKYPWSRRMEADQPPDTAPVRVLAAARRARVAFRRDGSHRPNETRGTTP